VRTFGQAIDAAIALHAAAYPASAVYEASVMTSDTQNECYRVELTAEHFSVPRVYYVGFKEQS